MPDDEPVQASSVPWSKSFHESFSVVPDEKPVQSQVDLFLSSDGRREVDVLAVWPPGRPGATLKTVEDRQANPRQFRNMSQLLRNIGLAYTDKVANENVVRVTRLGKELLDWRRDGLNQRNIRIIARYATRAIAAAQLKNPTNEARRYPADTRVFPFQFIWRAMLALDNRISLAELDRAIFAVGNEADLQAAIEKVRTYRRSGDLDDLGAVNPGTDEGAAAWMCWASFGWTLIPKRTHREPNYRIPDGWQMRVIQEAATIRQRHRDFASDREYVEHLSACAGLPPDVR